VVVVAEDSEEEADSEGIIVEEDLEVVEGATRPTKPV
jgi:hypothetical protein